MTRAWGPPFLKDIDGNDTGEAAYYLACNRGKQSVAIDFTKPEGRDLVLALARGSDALVENFKVGGLARYGLDYPRMAAINPPSYAAPPPLLGEHTFDVVRHRLGLADAAVRDLAARGIIGAARAHAQHSAGGLRRAGEAAT